MIPFLLSTWFVRTVRSVLLTTYYWQLKEYRWDRMKDFLFSSQSRQVFFSPYHVIVLLTLLVFIFTQSEAFWTLWLPGIMSTVFTAESILFVVEIVQRHAKRPRATLKSLLIVAMTIFWEVLLFALFVFYPGSFGNATYVALVLGVLMLLGHDLNALIVFALTPITGMAKGKLYARARLKRQHFGDLIVIGITGSYGKSSVKEFLAQLLETKYKVLKTAKNVNTEIGIAKTILNELTEEHEVMVCEMAAYQKGEIERSCSIALPNIGILTGINDQHLSLFGSQSNIVEAKWELIAALPLSGLAVLNGESKLVADQLDRFQGNTIVCSFFRGDVVPGKIQVMFDKVLFQLEGHQLEAPLLGKFNILNMTMAIATARHLGVKWEDIQRVLRTVVPPEKTMVLHKIDRGYVIDDSYNVNTDGFKAALDHMKLFAKFRKVVVFPGILELGKESGKRHVELGKMMGEVADEVVITADTHATEIEEGAYFAGLTKHHVTRILDPKKLFPLLDTFRKTDQVVYLFESRGGERAMRGLL